MFRKYVLKFFHFASLLDRILHETIVIEKIQNFQEKKMNVFTCDPSISWWKDSVVSLTKAVNALYSGDEQLTSCSMSILIPSIYCVLAKWSFCAIQDALKLGSMMSFKGTSPMEEIDIFCIYMLFIVKCHLFYKPTFKGNKLF